MNAFRLETGGVASRKPWIKGGVRAKSADQEAQVRVWGRDDQTPENADRECPQQVLTGICNQGEARGGSRSSEAVQIIRAGEHNLTR